MDRAVRLWVEPREVAVGVHHGEEVEVVDDCADGQPDEGTGVDVGRVVLVVNQPRR